VFDRGLEERTLLSGISLLGGVLTITGDTSNPNQNIDFALTLDATLQDTLDITINGTTAMQPLAAITQVAVVGLAGNDALTIDDGNGLIAVPVQFDGGGSINTLTLAQTGGTDQTSETCGVGALPGTGVDIINGSGPGGATVVQEVAFDNLASLMTSVPAATLAIVPAAPTTAFPITGSLLNGSNAVSVGPSLSAGFGSVVIDNTAPIVFANKTSLAINTGPGTDTISIAAALAADGLNLVTVTGGDPGAGDTLVYSAPVASPGTIAVLPSGPGSGEIAVAPDPSPHNVHFNDIGNLKVVAPPTLGDGLDIEGTAGNDAFVYTPGPTPDSGMVAGTLDSNDATGSGPFVLPPLTFSGIAPLPAGALGGVRFGQSSSGAMDTLIYNGPSDSSGLAVAPPSQPLPIGLQVTATVAGQPSRVVSGFGLANLLVKPGTGNRAVTVAGGIAVPVNVQGSGLAGTTLTFNGNGASTAVLDLGASTLAQAGFQPVSFAGVPVLNVNAAGAGVAVFGTTGPDDLTYTPLGARTATLTVDGSALTANFVNVGAGFAVDPKGGGDTIDVTGTPGRDTIQAASVGAAPGLPTVRVGALLPVTFNSSNTQTLVIDNGGGSDNLTVDSSSNPFPVPIDYRGNQSTLTLTGGTATQDLFAPGPGTSAIQFAGATQTVAFNGLATVLDTVAGPLTVTAGAANDVITYGPGSSAADGLVTVGSLEPVEFSNKTMLNLAAGPGDDTITLDNPGTPAALTAINVDGGPGHDTLVLGASGNAVDAATAGTIRIASQPPVTYASVAQIQVQDAPDQPLSSTAASLSGTAGTPLSNVLVAAFSDAVPGAGASDFTALIDWGDGTPAVAGQVVASGAGTFQVFGSHTYDAAGTAAVTVTVTDQRGSGTLMVGGVPITLGDRGGSTVPIASQATIAPAALEPQAQPVFGIVGMPVPPGTLVATFVTPTAARPGNFAAQVDTGNGPVAADVSLVPGSSTSVQVTTAQALTFPAPGIFPIRVTIEDNSGTPSTRAVTTATATIGGAPLVGLTIAPLTATQGTPVVAATVASFTDLNPLASPGNHNATIDWGDGSPSSAGTIIQPGGAGTPFLVLGNHTYAESGSYPLTITVQAPGGVSLTMMNTANVGGVRIVLTGQLNPSSDTGVSSSDAITSDNQPRFSGIAAPSSIIRLFAEPVSGGSAIALGQTAADASGAWQITSNQLPDGSYAVVATAVDSAGHNPTQTTLLPAAHPLVIDTVGPRVTGVVFSPAHGQVALTFQDDRSGLDLASLRNAAHYVLSLSPSRPRTAASGTLLVTAITMQAPVVPTAPEPVVLTFNHGRPLRSGTYTLTIFAAAGTGPGGTGVRDLAGNALDGEFYGAFPSGDGVPGGNFVARLETVGHRVRAPKSAVGTVAPLGRRAHAARSPGGRVPARRDPHPSG
jgi:hypothetical protein